MPQSNKEIAVSFLQLVTVGEIDEAYATHVSSTFRHHNPFFKGDALSLKEGMKENEKRYPHKIFEIRRIIGNRDFVVIHSMARLKIDMPTMAVIHIFRFYNGRIVELWDVAQEIPTTSLNAHGMF